MDYIVDYAWIIDHGNKALGLRGDEEVTGPRGASTKFLDILRTGGGEEFKMFDDDGIWDYTGRIVGYYVGDEPLGDFGAPNAGAVEIVYKDRRYST